MTNVVSGSARPFQSRILWQFALARVPGYKSNRMCLMPMRKRRAKRRGHRRSAGDARNDRYGNAPQLAGVRSPRPLDRTSQDRRTSTARHACPAPPTSASAHLYLPACMMAGGPRFPTSIRFAFERAKLRISSDTRESKRMMSADCKARMALTVRSSGSPGPAPTSVTRPALLRRGSDDFGNSLLLDDPFDFGTARSAVGTSLKRLAHGFDGRAFR